MLHTTMDPPNALLMKVDFSVHLPGMCKLNNSWTCEDESLVQDFLNTL